MATLSNGNAITICSSSKFYDVAKRLARALEDAGRRVFTPRFDYNEEDRQVSRDEKLHLTREFLKKIDDSTAIYVIANDGYTGRSVCIEIGYASAQGKKVYLSEVANEFAVQALTDEVIAPEEFVQRAH